MAAVGASSGNRIEEWDRGYCACQSGVFISRAAGTGMIGHLSRDARDVDSSPWLGLDAVVTKPFFWVGRENQDRRKERPPLWHILPTYGFSGSVVLHKKWRGKETVLRLSFKVFQRTNKQTHDRVATHENNYRKEEVKGARHPSIIPFALSFKKEKKKEKDFIRTRWLSRMRHLRQQQWLIASSVSYARRTPCISVSLRSTRLDSLLID